ncbi:glycosyltransferase family 20-domain-containing protein [Elsinoe ampelina]|uniref:Glycosyltransferase family 20-domain-containing protein n=1 Tax=Elsinoe ampelina TaxID=302913 RepID=A0A6A6GRD1_9PEZI|nr:glycosyltransferase family 20-domain-containing protein [Elsinoe ampelina]
MLQLDSAPPSPKPKLDPSKPILKVKPGDHPTLELSGRIISAVFRLPHSMTFTHEESDPWTLQHRPGTAALHESFEFLSGPQAAWKHTLVGWTGEITHRRARREMTDHMLVLEKYPPKDQESTPFPADGGERFPEIHEPLLKIKRVDRAKLEHRLSHSRGINMVPVWFTDDIDEAGDTFIFGDQDKWREFIIEDVFPVFHYIQPEVGPAKDQIKRWQDYVKFNKKFADRILEIYRPGDTVIVHDYDLMLVPAMLRARAKDIKIAFHMHTTFPTYEYFRCLSNRDELMEGLLGADMIAFQCSTFVDNFAECCKQLAGRYLASSSRVDLPDGRQVTIDVIPLGLDNDAIRKYALETPEVNQRSRRYARLLQKRDLKMIVGRDRVDFTKGVMQKLRAFSSFMASHPEWREKVVLYQVLNSPSRDEKECGAEYSEIEIEREAQRINGSFGTPGWEPVRLEHNMSKESYFTLLRIADLGLVTSVREGSSTFAIEFALINRDKHNPLIVSEFSGSINSLPGVICVNPFDSLQVGHAIHRALTLSAEDRANMYDQINSALSSNSVQKYYKKLLRRLFLSLELQNLEKPRPLLDLEVIKRYSMAGSKRLFIFDYDGTLTPIVMDPDAALPSQRLLGSLKELADDPRNIIWVISGRDQEFLSRHLGHIEQLGLSAEHGCFVKYPNKDEWIATANNQDLGWQAIVLEAFQRLENALPGSVVEKKRVSITWHYRRALNPQSPSYAKALKKRLHRSVGVTYDIEVMSGKANLEVRPKIINKGQVVRRLLKDLGEGPGNEPDFVLCCGDDTTDEDMFRALRRSELPMPKVFGVLVGEGSKHPTMASWLVKEPADIVDLIGELNLANKTSTASIDTPRVVGDPRPRGLPWFGASKV